MAWEKYIEVLSLLRYKFSEIVNMNIPLLSNLIRGINKG